MDSKYLVPGDTAQVNGRIKRRAHRPSDQTDLMGIHNLNTLEDLMRLLTPDFYASIHRTLVDIAALTLLALGLARIVLHDWKTLERPRRKKRASLKRPANERTGRRNP